METPPVILPTTKLFRSHLQNHSTFTILQFCGKVVQVVQTIEIQPTDLWIYRWTCRYGLISWMNLIVEKSVAYFVECLRREAFFNQVVEFSDISTIYSKNSCHNAVQVTSRVVLTFTHFEFGDFEGIFSGLILP